MNYYSILEMLFLSINLRTDYSNDNLQFDRRRAALDDSDDDI